DLAVRDGLNLQRVHPTEIGDLREGEGGLLDQPHGGGFRHQRQGHGVSPSARAALHKTARPSARAKPGYDLWLGVGQERPPGLCCACKTQENHMALEDDAPPRPRARLEKLLLDSLGVEELHAYIGELKAEIARVEADIARKQGHRSAADAFFRTKPT